MPNSRSDEDSFDPRDCPQPSQHLHLPAVIDIQALAISRARLIATGAAFPSGAGQAVHISSWPPYVLDYALESGDAGELSGFPDYRLYAAALDNSALMVSDSTIRARSEASSMAGDGELDRL